MTEVKVVELKPLFETQLGSWLYQTQLCPGFKHKVSIIVVENWTLIVHTAHNHAVLLRLTDDLIAVRESEIATSRFGRVLHCIQHTKS